MKQTTTSLHLLVVDDDPDFCASLVQLLSSDGHRVDGTCDLAGARAALSLVNYDALFVDQDLPDGDGASLLTDAARPAHTEVVIITGHATVHRAVASLHLGAADYLMKPTDPNLLKAILARLARVRGLQRVVEGLQDDLRAQGRFGPLIGRSPAMQPVFDMIQKVAATDAGVLIQGESGTGKELVAQALHQLSRRHEGPMVAVNCGAISETLIESELFGHEKGSFTGADRQHRGFFERADGGTLFLDEIAEMPLSLQVKLLRVLETGCVERIGGKASIHTDVRVLAATNQDPANAIAEGKLREDLYFRLAVFPIRLPPLREREGDVALLAQHFLDRHNKVNGTDKCWASGALAALAARPWRGNARELRNAVQRAYILAEDQLTAEIVPQEHGKAAATDGPPGSFTVQVGSSIAQVERQLVEETLKHVNGNKLAASELLGFSLKTLYNRINVYAGAPG